MALTAATVAAIARRPAAQTRREEKNRRLGREVDSADSASVGRTFERVPFFRTLWRRARWVVFMLVGTVRYPHLGGRAGFGRSPRPPGIRRGPGERAAGIP